MKAHFTGENLGGDHAREVAGTPTWFYLFASPERSTYLLTERVSFGRVSHKDSERSQLSRIERGKERGAFKCDVLNVLDSTYYF